MTNFNSNGEYMFNVNKLNDFEIIDGPGKYRLMVDTDPGIYEHPTLKENYRDTYFHTVLVNYRAVDVRKRTELMETIAGRELVPGKEISPFTLTQGIIINKDADGNPITKEIPMKGDIVTVTLAYATRNGERIKGMDGYDILTVSSYQVPQAKASNKFSLTEALNRVAVGQREEVEATEKVEGAPFEV